MLALQLCNFTWLPRRRRPCLAPLVSGLSYGLGCRMDILHISPPAAPLLAPSNLVNRPLALAPPWPHQRQSFGHEIRSAFPVYNFEGLTVPLGTVLTKFGTIKK